MTTVIQTGTFEVDKHEMQHVDNIQAPTSFKFAVGERVVLFDEAYVVTFICPRGTVEYYLGPQIHDDPRTIYELRDAEAPYQCTLANERDIEKTQQPRHASLTSRL